MRPDGGGSAINVESHELGPYSPVGDALVLAAVERAQRHDGKASRRRIAEHLGFKFNGATSRSLRPQLEALQADGLLASEPGPRPNRERWALTRRGARWLVAARRGGGVGTLPESPQHRTWRHAREEAGRRLREIREAASAALEEAGALVRDRAAPASAGRLVAVGERVQWDLWRLGAATYCLHEWPEPGDDRSDEGYGSGDFQFLALKSLGELGGER